MAYATRQPSSDIARIAKDFFQTVWRLQQQAPEADIVFRTQPELRFFANDVTRIGSKAVAEGSVVNELWVSFMGLIGPEGTLPTYFKEASIAQGHQADHPIQLLYDWLQQRSLQLLYQGWAARRVDHLPLKPDSNKTNPFTSLLASLGGQHQEHPWQHDRYSTYLHYFAAYFNNPRRPAGALEQILKTVLHQAVTLIPLQGSWMPIAQDQVSQLGSATKASLSLNAVIGARVWVPQAGVRLIIGPIAASALMQFFPDGNQYQLIQQLLLRYAGHVQHWELQLQIDNVEIQACSLGRSAWNRLGYSSFLGGPRSPGINSDITIGVNINESNQS